MMNLSRALRFACLVSLSIFAVWISGCGGQQAPPPPVVQEENPADLKPFDINTTSGNKPMLLSAEELKEQIQRGGSGLGQIRVLDARPFPDYKEGHIPKAVNVDVEQWKALSLKEGGLENKDAWSEKLGNLGVMRLTYVAVYADKPQDAARIWWTLKYLGVLNAAVLDGGWKQWVASMGEVTKDVPEIKQASVPVELQPARLAQISELKTSHKSPDVKVVDARSQDEFGKGRIPGSVRIEAGELLDADGKFRKPEELKKLFAERGIDEKKTAITYCEGGGRASLDAFALELAGFKNVKNYYCSWQQWSADKEAPVEK